MPGRHIAGAGVFHHDTAHHHEFHFAALSLYLHLMRTQTANIGLSELPNSCGGGSIKYLIINNLTNGFCLHPADVDGFGVRVTEVDILQNSSL